MLKKIAIPEAVIDGFVSTFQPSESAEVFHVFADPRTLALYSECHVRADKLVSLSTTDVPLDPEDQPDYRANRDIVADHTAFVAMKNDAKLRRSFSNIVTEFTTEFDAEHPLKIIGGQHRFEAIKEALAEGINEIHGIKVYFGLSPEQRLDAQLISNTVIAVPTDLYDRMQETMRGPELRDWCQRVNLLGPSQDFADKRQRGAQITVSAARTFILNYFRGQSVAQSEFDKTDTSPKICKSGGTDNDWEQLRSNSKIWKDAKLETAAKEFAAFVEAQRTAFEGKKKGALDFQEKALNYAVLSAWAYTAGILSTNPTRLTKHFALKDQAGRDPLNATALAKGRHGTDAENYRGLGYRTDAKERGRFVELFCLQAEKGDGITAALVDLAMKKYHAKQAVLEVQSAEKKVG
ncbi:hypothetical protein [Tunturiibacter psychrotolerans]|uniref:hypothetical protein n=1 Tax=Tunturiibacter psychrotolerans TaxID=3069686 RepID=UPI003D1DAE2C